MLFIKKSFIYKEEFGTVTKFNLNWKLVTKILEAYRKTPNISPGLIKNHKHFLMRLYLGGLIYGTTFVSGVFRICYFFLKKEQWNKTKKICSCSKISFYYLTANKTRDVFHNSGPLTSLRLKNT